MHHNLLLLLLLLFLDWARTTIKNQQSHVDRLLTHIQQQQQTTQNAFSLINNVYNANKNAAPVTGGIDEKSKKTYAWRMLQLLMLLLLLPVMLT